MGVENKLMTLLPHHCDDLRRSGLSDRTLEKWGVYSIEADQSWVMQQLGFGHVEPPVLALPVLPPDRTQPNLNDIIIKPDKPRRDERGHSRKYEMRPKSRNRVHAPLSCREKLFDTTFPLDVTEGQKKAEKGSQEGLCCIALPGVFNYLVKIASDASFPIEDLDKISADARTVRIAFDAPLTPAVRTAQRRLAEYFTRRGGTVYFRQLPSGPGGEKCGLDDFLVNHSVADYLALPTEEFKLEPNIEERIEELTPETDKQQRADVLRFVAEEKEPAERERLLKKIAVQTKIPVSALRESLLTRASRIPTDIFTCINQAGQMETLRLAQDYRDRHLWYGVLIGERMFVINSARENFRLEELENQFVVSRSQPWRSPMSPKGVEGFLKGGRIHLWKLFSDLEQYFRRHAVYKHLGTPTVITLWILGTYAHMVFEYFPYLNLKSLAKRCGKSRIQELAERIAFNSTGILVNPSSPSLYRDVEANGCTVFIDEVEGLDKEEVGHIVALLNVGFRRGGKVSRCEKIGDDIRPRTFEAYSPKCFAGIKSLPDTLLDRSLIIEMVRRKKNEEIERFQPRRLKEQFSIWRDELCLWGLQFAPALDALYQQVENLEIPAGLDDRAVDLFAPLFCIAALVDGDRNDNELTVTQALQEFARDQTGLRDSPDEGQNVEAIRALVEWARGAGLKKGGRLVITSKEAVNVFSRWQGLEWVRTRSEAQKLLRTLGFRSGTHREETLVRRGYAISADALRDLWERFIAVQKEHPPVVQPLQPVTS